MARQATCQRALCGTVIVAVGQVIGQGYNSPPGGLESQRRCHVDKASLSSRFKSDKTCCVHAEQRAIMDALARHPDRVKGSRLYFVRVDQQGKILRSGEPYCTICSKMALDAGVGEFLLWHETGITTYDTAEYNLLSFAY